MILLSMIFISLYAQSVLANCFHAKRNAVRHVVAGEGTTAHLTCPKGEVIYITRATYGRQNNRTFSDGKPHCQNIHCYAKNAKRIIKDLCNGKKSYKFKVQNGIMGSDPCPGTRKYANIYYKCLPVRSKTICQYETAILKCPGSKRIAVISATYGRSNSNTCKKECFRRFGRKGACKLRNTKCSSIDAPFIISNLCDDQHVCKFNVTDSTMNGSPCRNTFKYSSVRWYCY